MFRHTTSSVPCDFFFMKTYKCCKLFVFFFLEWLNGTNIGHGHPIWSLKPSVTKQLCVLTLCGWDCGDRRFPPHLTLLGHRSRGGGGGGCALRRRTRKCNSPALRRLTILHRLKQPAKTGYNKRSEKISTNMTLCSYDNFMLNHLITNKTCTLFLEIVQAST